MNIRRIQIKKTVYFVCLMIAILSFSGGVYADNVNTSNTVIADTRSNVLNGFVRINGYYYYYKNGVRVPEGWYMIGGKKTYLHAGGKAIPGWFTYSGQKFYLSMKGEVYRGFHTLEGRLYYFDDGGRTLQGWQTISGKRYFLRLDGSVQTGMSLIDGVRYYLHPTAGYALNRWQTVNGYHYYLSSYGRVYTGWQNIDGYRYYFNPTYGFAHSGWQIIDGHRYYLSSYGQAATGWKTIGSQLYYFDPVYGSAYTGIRTINGERYYFDDNGRPYTGVHYANGIKYTCDSKGRIISSENQVVRRAVIIGEGDYSACRPTKDLLCGYNDASAMYNMCKRTGYETVQYRTNVSAYTMKNMINTTFASADSNDISLFYYSGHGSRDGSLYTTNDENVAIANLRYWLDQIPGTIVVILDSCFSGQAINKSADSDSDLDAFNRNVISTFSGCTLVAETEGAQAKSGELARSKYQVLTASSWNEESSANRWVSSGIYFSYLTYGLVEGVGFTYPAGARLSSAPGDYDHNGKLTLSECQRYSAGWIEKYSGTQHVQIYPTNSSFVVFQR